MVGPCSSAEVVAATVPARGPVAVVSFPRRAQADRWSARSTGHPENNLRELVDIGIVVSSGASDVTPSDPTTAVAAHPDGGLAATYRMWRARDGGPMYGHAVVAVDGTIRDRAQGPSLADGLHEVLKTLDARRRRPPIWLPLLAFLAVHFFAMSSDVQYIESVAHPRWMDVFVGQTTVTSCPGET